MNVKISVFVICIETIIYLLLYNLHDCTFKVASLSEKHRTVFKSLFRTLFDSSKLQFFIVGA